VDKVEKWGTRKMAYRVAKQREGFYVLMEIHSAKGELIKELERRLKVNDVVIKYMTVRLDEEIKRKGKLVERRERRVRRRPRKPGPGAPVPAVAAAPAAAAPAAPADPAAPVAS
jgi:small subunit ribosomal protein S6